MRPFKLTVATLLTACLAAFTLFTLRWPLVSDAALIRYATFLLGHHWAPYRQIQDYNLPGAYAFDWLIVHTLGPGALAWRLADLALLALAALATYFITNKDRFTALYAFALFALFHARDGIAHTGQRDLTITVLLLLATAALLTPSKRPYLNLATFGLLVGAAATIKPPALIFLLAIFMRRPNKPGAPHLDSEMWVSRGPQGALAFLSAFLPLLAAFLWIAHHHATHAFLQTLTQLTPLHAALGYPGTWYLITHCLTASHLTLLLLAAALAITNPTPHPNRKILLAGIAFGILSFVLQGKGYPYQRYPFTAFLFLFAATEFTHALTSLQPYRKAIALAGLSFGVILAPLYTAHAIRERWPADPYNTMQADLAALNQTIPLDHKVQCLDTISGCIATLNALHLQPATGLFYDEFLFPQSLTPRQQTTVAEVRAPFLTQLQQTTPQAIVVTSFLFPRGPGDFAKLQNWPALTQFLDTCYTPQPTRSFPAAPSDVTRAYRIYLLQPTCPNLLPLKEIK